MVTTVVGKTALGLRLLTKRGPPITTGATELLAVRRYDGFVRRTQWRAIDNDTEARRITTWINDNPGASERDVLVRIADVVAENNENNRERRR